MKYLKKHWTSLAVIVLIVILSVGSFFIDLSVLQEVIRNAGIWAPFIYILIKSSTVIFAPLSGTALYIFSVPLFGFWPAVLYSFLGDLLGGTVTFYISRLYGQPVVRYFAGKKNMEYIENTLEAMSTIKGFVSVRLAALTMPEIASYAAGLTKLRFRDFIFIHMGIDIVPILVMSLPGLIFLDGLPVWFGIVAIISAAVITILSIGFFIHTMRLLNKIKK